MAIIIDDFKQDSPKWHMMIGRNSMTMADGGCGICTLADAVGKNPLIVGSWMESQGFIEPDAGTLHSAIVPTLRHFGYDGSAFTGGYVNGVCNSYIFREIYNYCASGYCVILLVGGLLTKAGGQCRNSYWSKKGHYILGCGARDGMLLIHDPASAVRTGWHSILDFEGRLVDSINGNLKLAWRTTRKWKDDGAYMFTVNVVNLGSHGASTLLLQELLRVRGFKGMDGSQLKLDGDAGANTIYAINSYQEARRKQGVELGSNGKNDGSCGTKMWKDLLAGL